MYLIGFMGSGKSTCARKLGRDLGLPALDLDVYIKRQEGMSPKDIIQRFGEKHFRELEHKALMKVSKLSPHIIACGGGIVELEENRAFLENEAYVVCLVIDPAHARQRISNIKTRPLFGDLAQAQALYERRVGWYKRAQNRYVFVWGKHVGRIAFEVKRHLLYDGILLDDACNSASGCN